MIHSRQYFHFLCVLTYYICFCVHPSSSITIYLNSLKYPLSIFFDNWIYSYGCFCYHNVSAEIFSSHHVISKPSRKKKIYFLSLWNSCKHIYLGFLYFSIILHPYLLVCWMNCMLSIFRWTGTYSHITLKHWFPFDNWS